MNKELTLFFPAGGFEAMWVPVSGKKVMNYLDRKRERELDDYVYRMNILSEGESDDNI